MGSQEEKAGAEIWDSSLQGGFGFEGWGGGGSLWDSLEMSGEILLLVFH